MAKGGIAKGFLDQAVLPQPQQATGGGTMKGLSLAVPSYV